MAGAKETPRQKMIGMMYLVLTAMLALNVSKEIIHAFVSVNESMVTTNKNFDKKLNETYTNFQNKAATDHAAVEWYQKALNARALSDSLVEYLIDVRSTLIRKTEGKNEHYTDPETGKIIEDSLRHISLGELKNIDNVDTPTNYFLGEGPGLPGEAKVMKERFAEYRKEIVKMVKPQDSSKLKIGLKTDRMYWNKNARENQNWETYMFYHTILAADVVILNKYIAEVRNIEFDVLTKLMSYVGASDFKFNMIEAKVIPEKRYVFKGDEYNAQILVAAYDTAENPGVRYRMGIDSLTAAMMNNATEVPGENGIVNLTIPTNGMGMGEHKYAGVVLLRDPTDRENFKEYHFNSTFNVGEPTAIISPDNLNVFYIGINNPVSISVPSIAPSKISYRVLKGGNILNINRSSPGKFLVKPAKSAKENTMVEIAAVADIDGQSKQIGSKEFRLMPLPPPTPKVAGFKGGLVAKNYLTAYRQQTSQSGLPFLSAELEGFLFDSDEIKYTVKSFRISAAVGGYSADQKITGNRMTPELRSIIQRIPANSNIIFESIEVEGPNGLETLPSPVVLKVN